MKNIHLIPTDKHAKQITITSGNGDRVSEEGIHHIAGSWVFDIINNKVYKTCVNIISGEDIKKIILTDNQELIKDGVQAIDDEFLEWFVNNPSCEEVEVNYQTIGLKNGVWQYHYQIIIPKEEPNPFELQKTLPDDVFYESLEPKQEATLEEAGGIAAGLCQHLEEKEQAMFIAGFIECAKWQSKRIYSEDDMRLSFKAGEVSMNRAILKDEGYDLNSYNLPNVGDFEEWFTNYKKK